MSESKKCNQLTEKKKGQFWIITEDCGCNAVAKIEYILNNKKVVKFVCKRHLKSNSNWLNKIQVPFLKTDLCKCKKHQNIFDFDLICTTCNNLIPND